MKRLALEPDARHGAVGDEGGAGQVAGVFEQPDKQEQQNDLRQEDEHRADARPDALDQQGPEPGIRQLGRNPLPEPMIRSRARP